MSQNPPTIGIRAEFDDEQAQRRMKAYQERIKVLEAVHNTLADRVKKGEKKKKDAVDKGSQGQIQALRKIRWELITLLFFTRMLQRAMVAAWQGIQDSAESAAERGGVRALARRYEVDVGTVSAALREVSNSALSVRESLQAAQAGLLQDQGQFVNEYTNLWQSARVAAVTSGADVQEVFEAMVQDLVEGKGEATDAVTPVFNLRYALDEYARSIGTTVDALDPMVAAQVQLQAIQDETAELIANGADKALEQADAVNAVKAAWSDFTDVTGVMAKELGVVSGAFEAINDVIRTATQLTVLASAAFGALITVARQAAAVSIPTVATRLKTLLEGVPGGTAFNKLLESTSIGQQLFSVENLGSFAQQLMPDESPAEAYRRILMEGLEAMGIFEDQVTPGAYEYKRFEETPERSYTSLVDHLIKRQKLIEDHERRSEEIVEKYNQRVADIELKHEQRLAKIERQRIREEEREWRQYYRKRQKMIDDHYLTQRQKAEDHRREMRQAEEKFRLEQIQRERMYQYERGLLVAYGDVLAIEDLDARHKLETEAREENHDERQQSEEEDYQDQRRHRQEQFEQDLRQLRDALDDYLEEIRLRAEERALEAEEQRKNELERAAQDRDQQLAIEEDRHRRSLEEWDQYWAKLGEKAKLGAEEITAVLREFFGEGSEADTIVENFMERWLLRLDFRGRLEDILGPESDRSQDRRSGWSRTPGGGVQRRENRRAYQYGGSGIVSSPTSLLLGEGHTPERFTIEPLSAASSNVTLRWGGGAIPVEGHGSMAGVDLGAVGDAVARGLVIEISQQMKQRRS